VDADRPGLGREAGWQKRVKPLEGAMARVLDLNFLAAQPEAYRDDEWEQAFLQAFVDGRIDLASQDPVPGPDGWPYMQVSTSAAAKEPVVRLLDWVSQRGIGIVVNAHKQVPDYVFTYGMIWNYKERGQFVTQSSQVALGEVEFAQGEKVLAGPPSLEYLPTYVRKILLQFFTAQGVTDPKVLVVSKDRKHFDLCFSLESLGNPETREHRGIAEALAWFLPVNYSLILMSEAGMPQFVSLNSIT